MTNNSVAKARVNYRSLHNMYSTDFPNEAEANKYLRDKDFKKDGTTWEKKFTGFSYVANVVPFRDVIPLNYGKTRIESGTKITYWVMRRSVVPV